MISLTATFLGIDLLRVAHQRIGILNYEDQTVSGEHFLATQVLPALIKSNRPVLLDVGANVGEYSLSLRSQFPNAAIWAFEPNPVTFRTLESKVKAGNIKCERLGLGSESGEGTLHCYSSDQTSGHASMYGAIFEVYANYGIAGASDLTTFAFPITTLDLFCERHQIQAIDFLKIDVEGHEHAVLEGASGMLSKGGIGAIQFEFTDCNVMSRVFLRDFYLRLPGYRLYRLNSKGIIPLGGHRTRNEVFQFQNILAIREELVESARQFWETWVDEQ